MSPLTSKLAGVPKRVWALIAAIVVAATAAAAVGGTLLYANAQPTLATFNLKDGAKEVAETQPLVISLSRPSTLEAVKQAFRLDPSTEGSLSADPGGRRFTWTNDGPFADLTTYTVSLNAFKDAAGHRVNPARWRFTTTIVPKLTAVTTDGGGQVADGAELPVGAGLTVAFNEPMDQAATKLTVNGAPVDLAWSADGRSAALSLKGQKLGAVTVQLQPGAKDSAGRPFPGDWKLAAHIVFKIAIHTIPLKLPALVQVPNDAGARDQSGLQAADMVWEYDTEGGITRLTALYTNAPDVIGPVRSGRLISFALDRHYRGLLFFSGLSDGSRARLYADPVPTFGDAVGYYYRTTSHYAPDNLYINGSSVQRAEDQGGYAGQADVIQRGPVPIASGDGGGSVSVQEHGSSYAFDPATGTYTKTEDGHLMSDAALGQPLRIRLLIVFHTTATTTRYVEDVNGVHGLDFNMESGGRADFYFDGFHAAGTWSAPDRSTPFLFKLDSGQQVKLPATGLTFVDVVRG